VPKFRYMAVDLAGKRLSGIMDAANEAAVAERVQRQNCLLLRTDGVGTKRRFTEFLNADVALRRGLAKTALAHVTRELAVLLESGQDIDQALRFLIETSDDRRLARILRCLRDSVRRGNSFAASLAEHPHVFSRLYVSLVRAGEAGGKLTDSLSHLADLLEREAGLAATIHSALIYPALLVAASAGTIILLLTHVLPQFQPIFAQAGAQLPAPTRVLLGIGDFVRDDGVILFVGLLCLSLLVVRALREPPARIAMERMVLHVPILGTFVRRVQAARLTRTLGTLLRNGVGLVPALVIGRDVLSNLTAAKLVDRATADVKAGARLAPSLATGKFFPVQTIHMVRLGEETGKLAELTLRGADIHDAQIRHTVSRMVALLVPVITVVMGLVVAGIVGSLLIAMLSLNDLAL
jgi:general secretion pathway protein F